jgi:hypothetical protein
MLRFFVVIMSWAVCACIFAQDIGTLRGVVADGSGALVPGAQVKISNETGIVKAATAGDDGSYTVNGLAAGKYTVQASSPGMTQTEPATVEVSGGVVTLNLTLRVVLEKQEITVQENVGPQVTTDPSQNAATLVMREESLDALSDDPDDLQADLAALAGPSAGPNGGQIYIDGFTAGDSALPSKDAIREVRVNQNPFSPEFDAIGYGRTEILTKPGRDRFRGQAYFNYGNDIFNSRNPYAGQKAPFDLKEVGGSVGGALTQRASFFGEIDQRNIDNGTVISAITLDPKSLAIVNPFTQVFSSPLSRLRVSPRIDYQLNSNNTLTFRYALTRTSSTDIGAGGFNLASTAYNQLLTEHAFQATETAVLGPCVVDETHFQFLHQHNYINAVDQNDEDPTIVVSNAFTGGGPPNRAYQYIHHHYEVQNYVSIAKGAHSWKGGVRLRAVAIRDTTLQNFDGTYTFGGAYAPILNSNLEPIAPGVVCNPQVPNAACQTLSSIQQYQRLLLLKSMNFTGKQIEMLGGGPTQFSLNYGIPVVNVGQVDAGLFAGDDWRLKPNLTLSLGLRYETQNNIHDRRDFAPRLGFAWAPGATSNSARPKTVVRGGFGVFYYRFSEQNVLIAQRFNDVNQTQYVLINPDPNIYPAIPSISTLEQQGLPPAIHTVSSSLVAPYVIQSALGIERQIPGNTTVAITYTNSHGQHLLLSRDINAPLDGTVPFPGRGPIYEMESGGLYNQNQLVVNINSRFRSRISLFGYYMLSYVNSNTDGVNTYPANQYSSAGEYGAAATDVRHRATIGGSIATFWDLRLSPLIFAQSGAPFNIITSQDVYGDTILSARPGIVSSNGSGIVPTKYGFLDPNPSPGEPTLPRNFGRGPGQFTVDLRLAKTFGLGRLRNPEARNRKPSDSGPAPVAPPPGPAGRGSIGGFDQGGGGGGGGVSTGRRYNLTASISARNLFNHVNPGPIIGNINSPLFGQANQIAGGFGAFAGNASNRRLEFQLRLAF